MTGRAIGNQSVVLLGEQGLIQMVARTSFSKPVIGPVTGHVYPFNIKPRMYVDRRDVVFLLGEELDIG